MKKNRAIAILLCIFVVLAGVTYIDIAGTDADGSGSASDINLGLDLAGGVSITYQVVGEEEPSATDMADTIAKLQKRVEGYSTEAIVYQEGSDRINIEIPGVSDANTILQDLGRPGALYFISQTDPDGNINYSQQSVQNADGTYGIGYVLHKPIEQLLEDGSILVQGTDVGSASAGTIQTNMGSEFVVSLTMTEEGTAKFTQATQNAFDKNESLAIYYDGNIISAPSVNAVITDGSAQISPMESYERAESLASTIRIGGLRLELEELHSKVVGAQLGVEAIDTSLKAGAIGLAIVMVFMIVVYLLPGVASAIGLLAYVALVILLLNGFDMTLTLSGVAGIILSIGMAVDANVIIFARIREELAAGKTVRNAVKIGFDKALSAIIDGNITTLIAAGVLLWLGPGTVKGFAQTLALGIVLSMFTALVVTRYLLYAFYALGLKSEKLYGMGKEHKVLNILSRKAVFFGISVAVIAAGFIVMGVNKAGGGDALNYSLEFKGGTATTVTFQEAMTLEKANADVVPFIEEITGSAVQIQTVQDSNEVIFKTTSLNIDQRTKLNQMFVDKFGVAENMITSETISSTISDEMKSDTIIAVVVAIVFMLIYIRIRFSDIRFGVSSIVALLHDVLVVLAFYAAARVSVSNTFVACMLTIVGYSINATIVIFDRIRENMRSMTHKDDLREIVDKSITQTMSRSIFTSLTTFIMVAVLYILGVTSIRDFALPLMVGIICGAYSSICLAGSLWYLLRIKFVPKKKEK
ncbi:protein translocase subunit SecD [Acetatifactor muris]|uniref:Multifunctional fusion protein n=1 Tax=Acetatifactor muris TaxID=879566 RepID=A0A2K4ZFQ9_9FIRM|nr:protein translocase subunit SecD [Acetatifactor muris]MCR2047694.1 protein translocase subunit SecD [Acetatifactor muris]SOY29298.1 bifunctional preprotein translocase subunit SecD/SecF [Acetatifactor muris]